MVTMYIYGNLFLSGAFIKTVEYNEGTIIIYSVSIDTRVFNRRLKHFKTN